MRFRYRIEGQQGIVKSDIIHRHTVQAAKKTVATIISGLSDNMGAYVTQLGTDADGNEREVGCWFYATDLRRWYEVPPERQPNHVQRREK
ncbi:MAG: hypothetical protein OXE84_07170 [Rhodobacteraceae bacterium]|nr:hypothetical protein [Paracoccaceae bacterium]MCY4197137.1 hypothetical protein [Paracoccaceae bacterium]